MAEKDAEEGAENELIIADIPEDQSPLVCVEYPGIVDNEVRAVVSLGGMDVISKAYYHKNQPLEARFRPEDCYCKPTVGRRTQVTNLVLRVKRRRRRKVQKEEGGGEEREGREERTDRTPDRDVSTSGEAQSGSVHKDSGYEYAAEVLGVVDTSFEFPGMADFQVLPPGLSSVHHSGEPVDPDLFQNTEPVDEEFINCDLPSFLPPPLFSKFDKPINYGFRPDPKVKMGSRTDRKPVQQMADRARFRRFNNAYSIPFDYTGPIPTEPHPDTQHSNHPKLKLLRQLFDERPVWSRLALQSRMKLPPPFLRSLLVLVSYYITSGPWKTLWVKLGYDPRQDPAAKIYQCVDFRVPKEVDIVERRRRPPISFRPTAGKPQLRSSRVFQLMGEQEDSIRLAQEKLSDTLDSAEEDEASYVFTVGQLPPQRQLYYQLCDLRDDRLQELIHCNDGQETTCTESNGWCEENTYDKLRKTLAEMTRKTAERVKAEHPDSTRPQMKT